MPINLVGTILTANLPDAEVGNADELELVQTVGRTAAGVVYVYNKGVEIDRLVLRWRNLTQDERDDLEDFWRNEADGTQETFTLQDTRRGLQWTARFLDTTLPFAEPVRDMQAADYGAHWSIQCTFEVGNERPYPVS